LNGAADLNADGRITVWELFEHVRSEVPPFVQQERGEEQLPQLIGEGESRVVLTRAAITESPPFSYCPAIPFAGAETWFRTEADSEQDPASLVWEFGDGSTAIGRDAVHRYQEPGSYVVRLSLQRDEPSGQASTQTIMVDDWATIISKDDEADHVVISVGRQHGIVIGDRFSLFTASGSSTENDIGNDPIASLEVVELIDEDMAACQVLDPRESMTKGTRLLPILYSDGSPCWE